ncbi:MAG: bifunctional transaldolase/phosoglucose isomerase [Dehalococcoidia bacterium]
MTRTQDLLTHGQSAWLDYIRRGLITSGELQRMVDDGWITGVTSNPTIFEKAIAGSADYDEALAALARRGGLTPYDAFVELAAEDIRAACDILRPVYDGSRAKDGYVSLEVPPGIESDAAKTVAEGKRLFALVGRPNVMIKVPGTVEGVRAVEELIAEGVNVNVTLLFALDAYERTAEAYIAGLERRVARGLHVSGIGSVASFFVSRLDSAIDAMLPAGSPLRGKAAVGNARRAYARFRTIFATERWARLAAAGAQVQRPLWASTGTKDPAYSDVLYVEELIAPDTVNTMPEATLRAVLDHASIRPTIAAGLAESEKHLADLAAAGIDLDAVTAKLLTDGLASFEKDFLRLLDRVESGMALARVGRPVTGASLGALASAVEARLATIERDRVVERIWENDHTVWKPDPTEITNRLEWLTVVALLQDHSAELEAFARGVAAEGYRTAVLLGMGGSSLAPEVLHATFGVAPGMLDLKVLDTTDPRQIADVEASIDLATTLFIVASKSGGTIETRSQFDYFWEKLPDGAHYVAITDPGSGLEQLGKERGVRRIFRNPAGIGGRYSALSFFGMVPAALIGADVGRFIGRAHEMVHACDRSLPAKENPGAWLGAVLGEAALAGRDKVTLVLPEALSTLGYWVEQLIAESTGKEGRGIVPVEGEPLGAPEVYGNDRIFIAIGDDPRLAALEAAGHPVVRLPYSDPYQLGAEFFRWEFATAIAGNVLQINPFDQPNVQEAKDVTGRILDGEQFDDSSLPLPEALATVGPGDYIAINAYLARNAETTARLAAVRMRLRDRHRVATTVGFGPRFLHSTGQLHKGGANNGVFLQVVTDDPADLEIPGQAFGFRRLKAAQALGDLASLKAHGRRVARLSLDELEAGTQG